MTHDTEGIYVLGFGSFFDGKKNYGDIDILLLHKDLSKPSCINAIRCKNAIIELQPMAHVIVLSKQEERSLSFISKSRAIQIGEIHQPSRGLDIKNIISKLIFEPNRKIQ